MGSDDDYGRLRDARVAACPRPGRLPQEPYRVAPSGVPCGTGTLHAQHVCCLPTEAELAAAGFPNGSAGGDEAHRVAKHWRTLPGTKSAKVVHVRRYRVVRDG